MQQYKITNMSDRPILKTWNKGLLDDEELVKYEAWKLTPEYVGLNDRDKIARKRVAEAVKNRVYFQKINKHVLMPVYDKKVIGGGQQAQVIDEVRYEWKWCLGANISEFLKDINTDPDSIADENVAMNIRRNKSTRLLRLRQILAEYQIPFTLSTPMIDLLKSYVAKFGTNVTVFNQRQWDDSGLKLLERRELYLSNKNNEGSFKLFNKGLVTAELITDEEAYDIKTNPKQYDLLQSYLDKQPISLNITPEQLQQEEVEELKDEDLGEPIPSKYEGEFKPNTLAKRKEVKVDKYLFNPKHTRPNAKNK